MDMKKTLLILLLLSLVNIGGVLLILYRSSDWNYHTLIAFSVKQLQHQAERLHNRGEQYLGLTSPNSHESSAQRSLKESNDKERTETSEVKYKQSLLLNHERRLKMSSSQVADSSKRDKSQDAVVTVTIGGRPHTLNISEDFTFPHLKCILRDTTLIAKTPWVRDLAMTVVKSHAKTIFAVTVSEGYKESLFNWLVSAVLGGAKLSLNQVLVIAMDRPTHVDLEKHGIVSVHVPPSSLFGKSSGISDYGLTMFTRISVVRLLNHWGISVFMFDTDALILRDPLPLFDAHPSSSMVASRGMQPKTLSKVWNTTVCNGALLIRSNRYIELFWKKVGEINLDSPKYNLKTSDQVLFNYALYYLEIEWQMQGPSDDPYFEGTCYLNGMRVSTIPLSKVCRNNCHFEMMDSVYIWHPLVRPTGESKMESANDYGLNFLSPHWSEMDCHSTVGEQWLQCISDGRSN